MLYTRGRREGNEEEEVYAAGSDNSFLIWNWLWLVVKILF